MLCLAPFVIGSLQGCGDDGGGEEDPGGNDGPLGACPPDSAAEQAAGLQALLDNCQACHAKAKTELQSRANAPLHANVDDPEYVSGNAEKIFEEIDEGVMPPTGRLPDATVDSIRLYLACESQ
ncbi:c-type cytochrome [Sorangium sp. So ce1078]|uniref:c-type cytochrome n=1 Tax=Sorangium sp. So ce1078 TaxID=3133329 RepID=UPI003F5E9869